MGDRGYKIQPLVVKSEADIQTEKARVARIRMRRRNGFTARAFCCWVAQRPYGSLSLSFFLCDSVCFRWRVCEACCLLSYAHDPGSSREAACI